MGQCIAKCIKPSISSNSLSNAKQTTDAIGSRAITAINNNINSTRSSRTRIVQNFVLVWLDSNINEFNEDFKHSLTQLRRIVNTINTFIESDQCIHFLTQIKDEKVFLIVSGSFSQTIVPKIHDLSQLDSIYVFCESKSKYEQWANEWAKIKGIFSQIEPICISLKQDTQQCDRDSIVISVTSKNMDRLEPSFMYTQLLKELLLEMEYDNTARKELCEFCRKQYSTNSHELQTIDDFEENYNEHTPIWWYTCECFTYQMLNRALRIQDVEVIIKMGFFLRDVHRHIEQLHSQMKDQRVFTVYRGKSMPLNDFDEIKQKEGGLLAFNTFLSTSLNETVSLQFAQKSLHKPGLVGVLFQITVDPSIQSSPFASIAVVSAIPNEEEILFSMHTIFRISQIKQIADRVWRVELTFTNDDDQELKRLAQHMRQETLHTTKLDRLGQLLIKMGNFNQAEEVYKILLEETPKDNEKVHASRCYYLGEIEYHKGNYKEALEFYQKSLEIQEKCLPSNHPDLASTYNGIGLMHDSMGEYSKALEFYQKSRDIQQTSISPNKPTLAENYNNTGAVYFHLGDLWKSLEFYQNSLEITLTYLPPNHPDMASIYNNIAQVYHRIQEYSKALEFYQKSLEIRQKSLPDNHPDLAILYANIGLMHCNMKQFSKAFEFYQTDLEIKKKSLPSDHPSLAITYNNIGLAHFGLEEYSIALEFYQKSLEIKLIYLSPNHAELATVYINIAQVYHRMQDYPNAIESYQKSLEILEKSLPSNHPNFAPLYSHIGLVHDNMGEYAKALEFYQKSLEINLTYLPPNHPDFASIYGNIGEVYQHMQNYSKALEFYQESLEIRQKLLPQNHPILANLYSRIGLVHYNMGDFSKALEFYQKDLQIKQESLASNHPHLVITYNNIGSVHFNMGDFAKALEFYQKSLEINLTSLPPDHSDLASTYNIIGLIYWNMGEFSKALHFYEHAVEIGQTSLPENHPYLQLYRICLAEVKTKCNSL